jgi:DNA (cytosine-5)-methyltransferase 1
MRLKVASFFSGAGGMDLGFEGADFKVVWANEYDKKIWDTYRRNFQSTALETNSIKEVNRSTIPPVDGIIGGPPCQSWSEAGMRRGIADSRGLLIDTYLEILKEKMPKFFLLENVPGIRSSLHNDMFNFFVEDIRRAGYVVSIIQVNAADYGVAQDRFRVFIVAYRADIKKQFREPQPSAETKTLRDVIYNLRDTAIPFDGIAEPTRKNHEYLVESFSYIYMSRNRVRQWNERSFTIQASGRHVPLHPGAPPMEYVKKDEYRFLRGQEEKYRRLTVRECARIQSFPDTHVFYYKNIRDGYKMVGNAVPVKLAQAIAERIRTDIIGVDVKPSLSKEEIKALRQEHAKKDVPKYQNFKPAARKRK